MKLIDAVKDAGAARFRAIFLTTVTTLAGLMPLILEPSPDARMLVPMAIALAYGIGFGTIFILLILPVLLVMNNRNMVMIHKIVKRTEVEPESLETAVINDNIEKTLSRNMEKEFDS
jgi:predicted RND superfamily exporter protein